MTNSTWGLSTYRDFARATFEVGKLSRDQMGRIVAKLHELGHTFTQDAMRQHFQKMIRQDKATASLNAAAEPNNSDASHNNAKPPLANKRGASGRRPGTKRTAKALLDSGEDDDEFKLPKKRIRKGRVPAKANQEDADESASPTDDAVRQSESTIQVYHQQPMTPPSSSDVPPTSAKGNAEPPSPPEYEDDDES